MSAASSVYDAVTFQSEWLGRDLWTKQQELCRAVETYRTVSVKGCHGSGKTYAIAGLIPYELIGHEESIVLTVAPTLRQVKNMWSEIETAIRAAETKIRLPERTATGWELSEKCKAIGFSSSKGVNAQGYHGKRVLILKDEAIGISAEVNDAIEGIRAGGDVRVVELCNPTVPAGLVYENFTRNLGTPGHHCITISAFDTPNLQGLTLDTLMQLPDSELDIAPFPHLTRRRWVWEMYHKWGPKNPRFVSRVLGEFPAQSMWAVFHLAWIEVAKREPTELELRRAEGNYIQVGVDVAGPGDDETAACARVNGIILDRAQWIHIDASQEVADWLHRLRSKFPRYPLGPVVVDIFGIGADLGIALARQGFNVMGFQAGGPAQDAVKFLNAKSEAYWRLRDMYRVGYISHLPGALDEDKEAQLCTIEYREVGRGLIQIEPKEEARKRGVQSPDRAEAEILAFCRVVSQQEHVDLTSPVQISPY